MNIEELKVSAFKLVAPSKNAAEEFLFKSELMAEKMNEYFMQRSDVEELIGKNNIEMMKNYHRNHARFISSLFMNFDGDVLTETILWVFRAYRNHGFHLAYWPAQLDIWMTIFKEHLSENTFLEIKPIYHWMIINNPNFAKLSDHFVMDNQTIQH